MVSWAMHFASGDSLGTGLAMLAIAGFLPRPPAAAATSRLRRTTCLVLGLTGALFVVLSTTPLPWLVSALLAVSAGLLLFVPPHARGATLLHRPKVRRTAVAAFLISVTCVFVLEFRTLIGTQRIPLSSEAMICVLGDSLSANETDPRIVPWPQLLREEGLAVTNLARMGATEHSALQQASLVPDDVSVVVLLIGGNDVLGTTPAGQFDEDLAKLLRAVQRKDRTLILFELPLPPLAHSYGKSQRARAREFGAVLLSKRILARVFADPARTTDGIHLSQAGHRTLANLVLRTLTFPDALTLGGRGISSSNGPRKPR